VGGGKGVFLLLSSFRLERNQKRGKKKKKEREFHSYLSPTVPEKREGEGKKKGEEEGRGRTLFPLLLTLTKKGERRKRKRRKKGTFFLIVSAKRSGEEGEGEKKKNLSPCFCYREEGGERSIPLGPRIVRGGKKVRLLTISSISFTDQQEKKRKTSFIFCRQPAGEEKGEEEKKGHQINPAAARMKGKGTKGGEKKGRA